MVALIRQALRNNPTRQRTAAPHSIPAPVGGWNARDSVAAMNPLDAVVLDNMWPTASDVGLRNGYASHVTGITGQVESLMAYNSPTVQTLFAAAGTSIYDATTAGVVGAASVTSLTNARWQHINVATSGGNFLMAVNGADKLRGYNGTSWYADGDGTHDITGVNTNTWVHLHLFKRRVWGIEKDSLKAWYLGTDAIAGGATAIDFRSIAKRGGYLVAMGSWTIDAGEGVDDYAVWVTSEGEVIVYKGTDPTSATAWALQGVWHIGAPIGRRCVMKYGGDCLLITLDGVLPLSKALSSDRTRRDVALTDKILDAMNTAGSSYSTNFGWQLCLFPKASMVLLNVPISEGSGQHQYVMNSITGAWARFTGWAGNCFEVHKNKLYMGGNGTVYEMWEDLDDNGSNITGNAMQAFTYLGMKGRRKQVTQARPILATSGSPSTLFGINYDFATGDPTGQLTFSSSPYARWGVSKWGVGLWGTSTVISSEWQATNGIGIAVSPRLKISCKGLTVRWRATDLLTKPGEVI